MSLPTGPNVAAHSDSADPDKPIGNETTGGDPWGSRVELLRTAFLTPGRITPTATDASPLLVKSPSSGLPPELDAMLNPPRGSSQPWEHGTNLSEVARRQLTGMNEPTEAEVRSFTEAMRRMNPSLANGREPRPGELIRIPQREPDGSFTYRDARISMRLNNVGVLSTTDRTTGQTRYMLADGTSGRPVPNTGDSEIEFPGKGRSVERGDSTRWFNERGQLTREVLGNSSSAMQRRTLSDGSTIDQHTGDRKEHNFILNRRADGRLTLSDLAAENPRLLSFRNDGALTHSRENLMRTAEAALRDQPLLWSKFQADMIRLENRNLTGEQINNVYQQIQRVFDATSGDSVAPRETLPALATQLMSQAASPGSIDQGGAVTCTMAAAEVRTFTLHPELAVKMVADMALAGRTRVGNLQDEVTMPTADSLKPATEGNPPFNGERSFASQIFQLTAANAIQMQMGTASRFGRLNGVDAWTDTQGNLDPEKAGRAFHHADSVRAYDLISGAQNETGPILLLSPNRWQVGDGTTYPNNRMMPIQSEAQLRQILESTRQFPLFVAIEANLPGIAGVGRDNHMMTITGYDATTGRVRIDNQSGSRRDGTVTVGQLFNAINYDGHRSSQLERFSTAIDRGENVFEDITRAIETSRFQEWPNPGGLVDMAFKAISKMPEAQQSGALQRIAQLINIENAGHQVISFIDLLSSHDIPGAADLTERIALKYATENNITQAMAHPDSFDNLPFHDRRFMQALNNLRHLHPALLARILSRFPR